MFKCFEDKRGNGKSNKECKNILKCMGLINIRRYLGSGNKVVNFRYIIYNWCCFFNIMCNSIFNWLVIFKEEIFGIYFKIKCLNVFFL